MSWTQRLPNFPQLTVFWRHKQGEQRCLRLLVVVVVGGLNGKTIAAVDAAAVKLQASVFIHVHHQAGIWILPCLHLEESTCKFIIYHAYLNTFTINYIHICDHILPLAH